eukprot:6425003-Prymnesium_polylepis.1
MADAEAAIEGRVVTLRNEADRLQEHVDDLRERESALSDALRAANGQVRELRAAAVERDAALETVAQLTRHLEQAPEARARALAERELRQTLTPRPDWGALRARLLEPPGDAALPRRPLEPGQLQERAEGLGTLLCAAQPSGDKATALAVECGLARAVLEQEWQRRERAAGPSTEELHFVVSPLAAQTAQERLQAHGVLGNSPVDLALALVPPQWRVPEGAIYRIPNRLMAKDEVLAALAGFWRYYYAQHERAVRRTTEEVQGTAQAGRHHVRQTEPRGAPTLATHERAQARTLGEAAVSHGGSSSSLGSSRAGCSRGGSGGEWELESAGAYARTCSRVGTAASQGGNCEAQEPAATGEADEADESGTVAVAAVARQPPAIRRPLYLGFAALRFSTRHSEVSCEDTRVSTRAGADGDVDCRKSAAETLMKRRSRAPPAEVDEDGELEEPSRRPSMRRPSAVLTSAIPDGSATCTAPLRLLPSLADTQGGTAQASLDVWLAGAVVERTSSEEAALGASLTAAAPSQQLKAVVAFAPEAALPSSREEPETPDILLATSRPHGGV